MHRHFIRAGFLLGLWVVTGSALADQTDPRLDPLFGRLQGDLDQSEARAIEREIWELWIDAADPAVDELMREGVAALAERRLDDALFEFARAIEAAPDLAEAWNKRATVHYLLGNFTDSVQDIQRTLELEPRHFGALSGLGLIYDAIGEPEAALRSFEAALAIHPHMEGPAARVAEIRRSLRGRRI